MNSIWTDELLDAELAVRNPAARADFVDPGRLAEARLAIDLRRHPQVQTAPAPGVARPAPRQLRHRPAWLAGAVVVALAAVLFVTLVTWPDSPSRGAHRATASSTSPSQRTAPWRLTGYVAPPSWGVDSTGAGSPARGYARGLSCPTTSFCVWDGVGGAPPVGAIMVSHDGGTTWQQAYTAPADMTLLGVTCPSATVCMVAAQPTQLGGPPQAAMIETTDGGVHWTALPMPGSPEAQISGLSCATATDCVVVGLQPAAPGSFVDSTTDGGTTWVPSALPGTVAPSSVSGPISCVSSGRCIVTGSHLGSGGSTAAAAYSTDGGRSWTSATVPAGAPPFGSVSCWDATHCVAIGTTTRHALGTGAVLATSDGGAHWAAVTGAGLVGSAAPGFTVVALTCPASTVCWGVGQEILTTPPVDTSQVLTAWGKTHSVEAAIVTTSDGGGHWATAPLPATVATRTSSVHAVSCLTAARCLAAASNGSADVVLSTVSAGS